MKLAVVGSREFTNYNLLCNTLDNIPGITTIVSGGARGADTFASLYAKQRNIPVIEFKPDWNKYGKSAGFIRNKQIVDECDQLIAFWDGVSRGTNHSIKLAISGGKLHSIVKF